MKLKFCSFFFTLLLAVVAHGQLYKISGVVLDNRKEPLPLASLEIKELKKGLVSKDDGS